MSGQAGDEKQACEGSMRGARGGARSCVGSLARTGRAMRVLVYQLLVISYSLI